MATLWPEEMSNWKECKKQIEPIVDFKIRVLKPFETNLFFIVGNSAFSYKSKRIPLSTQKCLVSNHKNQRSFSQRELIKMLDSRHE
jgi:hypothetical protein